jgi:hypothetical protein
MRRGQERDAAAASEGGLVTFRQQIGYGVHVLVMMGTFYALGHYAAAHVSRSAAHVRPLLPSSVTGVICGCMALGT